MFIVSIKATYDILHKGNFKTEWLYMGSDDGSYGSGYPCWCYSLYSGKTFPTQEAAKEWFEQCKKYLFGEYYSTYQFDMNSLAVREITFKEIEKLKGE